MTKDRYLSMAVLLMVAIFFVESGNIPEKSSWQAYGSAVYPQFLLVIIAALALTLLLVSFITGSKKERTPSRKSNHFNWKTVGVFALFSAYAALLPMLGYLASTFAFMVATQALLMGVDTRKKLFINLTTAGILVPLVYAIFEFGLNIWLP